MDQKEKRRELLTFIGAILIIAVSAFVLALKDYRSARSSFPMWKEPEELPPAREEWLMEPGGSVDIGHFSGEGLAWHRLKVSMKPPREGIYDFCNDPVILDYAWGGRWHTVYEGKDCYTVSSRDGGAVSVDLRLPSGIFRRDGRYRVRLCKTGREENSVFQAFSREFTAKHWSGPVEGMEFNDYPVWEKAGGEDIKSESLTLTAGNILVDEQGRTLLEYRAVNRGERCGCLYDYRVDRLWQGSWYTVSPERAIRGTYLGYSMEPGEQTGAVEIPEKVAEHPGEYRVYWNEAGYCEFTVE